VEDEPVTPSELGKELGISARKVNKTLEDEGYQERNQNGDWAPTDKGRPFCTVNPYKSPHSEHTGYRILWYRRVLDEITKAETTA
jgi:predicted ArsR family transcriptional regulator